MKCLLPSFDDSYSGNLENSISSNSFDSASFKGVNGVTMAHLNIRSLVKNIDELRQFTHMNNPGILTLSETWLDSSISDEEIAIVNYSLERKDRCRNGGGTAIYLHERFVYDRLPLSSEFSNLELVTCSVKLPRSRPLLICSVYRPPDDNNFIRIFLSYLEQLSFESSETFLLGDFNLHTLSPKGKDFVNSMNDIGLNQLITDPTRVTLHSSTILDLIFTNSSHRVTHSGVINLSMSDHYMVFCNRTCKLPRPKPKVIKVHSFKGFDPSACVTDLQNQPWDTVYLFECPGDAWFAVETFLKDVCIKHAPLRTLRVRGSQPPWMSDLIRSSIKERNKLKRRAIKSKLDQDWVSYKYQRNAVTRQIELAKRDYFNDLLTTHAHDASKLWSAIRKLIPKKNKVSVQEMSLDNAIHTDSFDIANCFNKFFTSVGTRLTSALPVSRDFPTTSSQNTPQFVFKDISVDFVRKELSSLRVNKSSGLKDIHSRILKVGANILAAPLTHIYNLSTQRGEIPNSWKAATVTPLHKGGSLSDPNNFRPISVLPAVMKILERAIHKQLYEHLMTNKLLSPSQSGFRPGHSTCTALLDVSDYILKNIDKGNLIGAVFLDLSKAFDMIDHSILKTKLSSIGVRGRSLAWFDNYLSNRTQSVTINGNLSDSLDLKLGVPQGSVLGPLLFIIFINDLPSVVRHCKVVLYADDTALFFAEKNVQTIQSILQDDLNVAGEWFSGNRLLVNCVKTKVMLFGSNQRLARSGAPNDKFR